MADSLRTRIQRALNMEGQGRLVESRRARWVWIVVGCLLIGLWQGSLIWWGDAREAKRLGITASSGLQRESDFAYFYRYQGLYPVATTRAAAELEPSRAGAARELETHGSDLRTEIGHTTRYGDLGKVWLYFPDLMLRGFRPALSVRPANAIAFVLALMLVYASACLARWPVFGVVLVLMFGSSPFQIYETYIQENVFGWPIIALLLVLAINLPLIAGRSGMVWRWTAPVLNALVMATIRQIRSEPALIIGAAGVVYLLLPGLRWRARLGLPALLVASFMAGTAGWNAYFRHKIREADQVVALRGGHPYPGPRDLHHMVWHPIWCGLGDFGAARGYVWDDRAAARYALPLLQARQPIEGLTLQGDDYNFRAYWDDRQVYYRTPYELPEYNQVLKEKILSDIARHPFWYTGILARRGWRVLTETSPVCLAVGSYAVQLPIYGWMVLPVLGLLAWARAVRPILLIALAGATSLTAIIVYSGGNTTMYSSYHLLLAALLAAWAVELLLVRKHGATVHP